jgi:hypothetical protein
MVAVTAFVVCPNLDCKRFTLSVLLFDVGEDQSIDVEQLDRVPMPIPAGYDQRNEPPPLPEPTAWHLVPASEAKIYPEYIPKPVRDDYEEACLIRDLSPKASATLARRCLQGMIRDFHDISKGRLKDEINALKDRVAPLTWQAIDTVRSVGNIGAHMEKDINVIVDVDPQEAAMLIGLIEMLMEDWYINRHEREQQLSNIVALGEDKEQARKPPLPPEGVKE